MALLQCPSCGGSVSEKASSCPHCNSPVCVCPECKSALPVNSITCPCCGFPLEKDFEPKKQKNKVPILIVILLVLFGGTIYSAVQSVLSEDYTHNLTAATYTMLNGGSMAEEAGNFVLEVWHDAIYDEPSIKTATYLVDADDFNDALSNLYGATSFKSKLSAIQDNQDEAKALMQKLQNPSRKNKEAYAAIKELYNAYLAFTNMVMSPDGSYTSFSSAFADADAVMLTRYKAMELYIEQ